ncbi:MAG: serine/threonine protein phosphatase [Magnetospirillum sp.]|nr:serine/threonine protein phosphatase [Magnetospirillum sp.]
MEMTERSLSHPHDRIPKVPDGTRVYAIGDIHGRLDLLESLFEDICDEIRQTPVSRPVVVFLGDLIDRGPDSRRVIERIMGGPEPKGPLASARYVCLRGNHEDTMLEFLADFSVGPRWFRNGGLDAIRSYVGQVDSALAHDYPALQRLFYRALPGSHLRFLSRNPAFHVEGDYLFVHAGIRPGIALEHQDSYDMMWMREPFLSSEEDHGKMVVHGHSIVPEPESRHNRIAIDTGAYRTGRLTCLVLDGAERRFLST